MLIYKMNISFIGFRPIIRAKNPLFEKNFEKTSKNFFRTSIPFEVVHQTLTCKYGIDASEAAL